MNEIVELIVFNILTSAALWTKLVDNKGAGNLKRTIEVYTDAGTHTSQNVTSAWSNSNRYECTERGEPPTCLMTNRSDIETTVNSSIYCNECKTTMNNHLQNHH